MAKRKKSSTAVAKPRLTKEEREWRAQSDLSTLRTAEEIRNDQTRVRAAQSLAERELRALKKIAKSKLKK